MTPAATSQGNNPGAHRPMTPQQAATPAATPITKAIALLQHRSSATPSSVPGRTARTAELSARKAELASLLNQVNKAEPCCADRHSTAWFTGSSCSCSITLVIIHGLKHSTIESAANLPLCLAIHQMPIAACCMYSSRKRPWHEGSYGFMLCLHLRAGEDHGERPIHSKIWQHHATLISGQCTQASS